MWRLLFLIVSFGWFLATPVFPGANKALAEENVGQQPAATASEPSLPSIDLSGRWKIQEEDKEYEATLDVHGNGTYTWQGGKIFTTSVVNGLWEGTWVQTENDREGGFEVLLSEDRTRAEGSWWYTRFENFRNIPPGMTGGPYTFIRLTPVPRETGAASRKDVPGP